MLFPQGIVPLIFLIIGARVKSWFLALYLPHAWSWATAAVMISIRTVLYTQAIRLSSGRTRNRRTASPEAGADARDPHGTDRQESLS